MLDLLQQIKPTKFISANTEALSGEFVWVDDQPTAYEFMMLEQKGWLQRWYQVNSRKNLNELLTLIENLNQYKSK